MGYVKRILEGWIDKAEQYVGDIMYEVAQGKVKSNNHEEIMRVVEQLSDKDIEYCREEALFSAGLVDYQLKEMIMQIWKERGF